MNKLIELSLAKEIIELSSKNTTSKEYVIRHIEKGNIIEDDAVSGLSIIKELMGAGVSPIVPIEYKDKIASLLEHVADNAYDQSVTLYIIDNLTKDDFNKLSPSTIENIYSATDSNCEILEKFFNLGFDFKQGEFNEVDKALNSDIGFFELCLRFKTNFKFNHKYDDLFLDEHITEDLEYMKKNNSSYFSANTLKSQEGLILFLKKARETEELKDNLSTELKHNNIQQNTTYKI
jgi:hypothetical protein